METNARLGPAIWWYKVIRDGVSVAIWRYKHRDRPHKPGVKMVSRVPALSLQYQSWSLPSQSVSHTHHHLARKNAFYSKFCNIHSHDAISLLFHHLFVSSLSLQSCYLRHRGMDCNSVITQPLPGSREHKGRCSEWAMQLLILQIIWSCSLLNFNIIKIENHWKWTNKNLHSTCWITCSFILAFQTFL